MHPVLPLVVRRFVRRRLPSPPRTPGKSARDTELEEANAEIDRLSEAIKELAVKLMLLEKKGGWTDAHGPVPARVDAATKTVLLQALEHALAQGWPLVKACAVLGLEERRPAVGPAARTPTRGWTTPAPVRR